MPVYKINKLKLEPLLRLRFDLEKDVQRLTEQNLEALFGLKFISGASNQEFHIPVEEQEFYIDTLAFDEEQRSFVIIEYKKDRSFSVIDQGFAYLSAVINHKADMILELNERFRKSFKKEDIDWDASRVIFISPEFTNYQKNAINFKDLPFYLYEVDYYSGDFIDFSPIKPYQTSASVTPFIKDAKIQKVVNKIKVFSVEDHYKKASPETIVLLDEIRDRIKQIDGGINEKPVGNYIGYKMNWYNFVSVHVYKYKLKIFVRKEKFTNDSSNKLTKIPESYKWGKTALWWIDVKSDKTIDYLMPIITESYNAAPDK